jgi:PKD repeat protein
MSWRHPARGSHGAAARTRAVLALAAVALAGACGDDGVAGPDAAPAPADAAPLVDAQVPGDAAPALTWVDFAIAGCAATSPGDPGLDAGPGSAACQGQAPLTVQLAAVVPAAVDVYVWDFGDAPASDPDAGPVPDGPTPTHVYELPGVYDVSLSVRGPGGSAMARRQAAVVVTAAVLGAPCQRDAQCGADRECVCDGESGCAAPLRAGMCSASCGPDAPCAGGVCANLAAAAPAEPLDWQRSLCVPACEAGVCPAGLTCQEFPAGDGQAWVQGCFAPGVLGAIGSSCKDASGAPDPHACAGGVCLDIGARGACSAPCADTACPASAACASLDSETPAMCVQRCTEGAGDCLLDPWLACEAPGAPGGFIVTEPASPDGYCTPRTCTEPEACGPDGTCTAGYCAPR